MAASTTPDLLLLPLSLNFRKAQAYYNDVEGTSLSGNDPKLQEQITQGLALSEAALRQVSTQSVFSQNELVDDLNTGDLRYLLLPFYRGELLLRVTDQSRREALLGEALACLRGFLDDLRRLEVLPKEVARSLEAAESTGSADLATLRDLKVARFKANKINKARMEVLAGRLRRAGQTEEEEEDGEEIEREHMLLLIGCCTHTALDSIRAAEQEQEMLEQVAALRLPDGSVPRAPPEPREAGGGLRVLSVMPQAGAAAGQPAMPQLGAAGGLARPGGGSVVGTWEETHGRVSYANAMQQIHTGEIPGLYTYTVEEWLRQEEAERALKEAQGMDEMEQRAAAKELAKEEREYDIGDGEEDLEERRKLIAQDEFRDSCKRGSGNRHNRS